MEIEVSEKEKRRSDPYIWGIIIILYIVSVVEVYSAISREITGGDVYSPIIKHIMLLFSGFVITYVTSQIHYKWFKVLAYLMIPLTIVLLVIFEKRCKYNRFVFIEQTFGMKFFQCLE